MTSVTAMDLVNLNRIRREYARDPDAHALEFARALNRMAVDYGPLPGAVRHLDEAEHVLRALVANHGETPPRVHILAMALANQAQLNAFSGEAGWADLARALDASTDAVFWARARGACAENASRAGAGGPATADRAMLAQVLLVHARVQAACALVDDAVAAFREAEELIRRGGIQADWSDALRTVAAELGFDSSEWGEPLAREDRVARWYWYG